MAHSSPSPVLSALRAATASAHKQLEQLSGSDRIMDGTLDPEGYLRLIRWQARAHGLLEPVVLRQEWEGYTYQSRMSALPPVAGVLSGNSRTPLSNAPLFALGVAYVLEGGSLGGSAIHKKLLANPGLEQHRPFPFYARQASHGVAQWRSYLGYLTTTSFTATQIDEIAAGGKAAFAVFSDCWIA